MIADSGGNVCYDADFYPYGGERVVTESCAQNGTIINPNNFLNPATLNQTLQNSSQFNFGTAGTMFGFDEFDLLQLQNQQPERACVTTDDGLGNVTTTCD